jgi:hypothetical protein
VRLGVVVALCIANPSEEGMELSFEAISLKQSSTEHMDIGSVLSISMEAIGSIATLASLIHQVMVKHDRDVVLDYGEGRTKIAISKITLSRIRAALTRASRPQTKLKPKRKQIEDESHAKIGRGRIRGKQV